MREVSFILCVDIGYSISLITTNIKKLNSAKMVYLIKFFINCMIRKLYLIYRQSNRLVAKLYMHL